MAKVDPNNKYVRKVTNASIDVYDVLVAFNVTCPARQHAVKKLLCSGLRGKGSVEQDLREAAQAVERAIDLENERLLEGVKAC